ncbi:MAG: histidine phosphatase family protein [Actinomycetota bacterium]
MSLFRYISHANVVKDPEVPVPRWGLDDTGRRRVATLAEQPWLSTVDRFVCSAETKAIETATILAERWQRPIEIRPETGETDRSATGYVPEARHAELAARYFAEPARSADGWETAIDGQLRVIEALADLLVEPGPDPAAADGVRTRPDIAVIGHGGVGTLLWCHLAGAAIDQANDQPGQGHYWTWDRSTGAMLHRWHPIDAAEQPPSPPA